jgi:hypothetical protein
MYPSIYSYIREREREREREGGNGQAESIRIGKQGSSRGKRMNESCETEREREREICHVRLRTSSLPLESVCARVFQPTVVSSKGMKLRSYPCSKAPSLFLGALCDFIRIIYI